MNQQTRRPQGKATRTAAAHRRGDGAAPPGPDRAAGLGPDLAAAVGLAAAVAPVPAWWALSTAVSMCLACGADLVAASEPCATCHNPPVVVPAAAADGGVSPLGTLHRLRGLVRRQLTMRIAAGPAGATLLLPDGRTAEVAAEKMPPVAEAAPAGIQVPPLRSPVGRILLYATAVDASAVTLPWSSQLLLEHAFAIARSQPQHARSAALDALALGRVELLAGLDLGGTERTWLTLVHAARKHDHDGVVGAAAALPADRYRHKIGVLAAYAEQVARVPGAAERLAPALRAYALSEPLAGALQRRLGLAGADARQRLDDLALRAARFRVPEPIAKLAATTTRPDGDGMRLLSGRGRLAVLVAHPHPAATPAADVDAAPAAEVDVDAAPATAPAADVDVDGAPVAVLDDLIDAGAIDVRAVRHSRRPEPERAYLIGRTAPAELSDEQVDQLGHRDEALRRRFVADGTIPGGAATGADGDQTPFARHLDAVGCLLRNRPQDVRIDTVLPDHRTVAERLIRVLQEAESGQGQLTQLDGTVLGDRSTWLPLVGILGIDRLCGSRDLAVRAPRFTEWLFLMAAREHLFLADWRAGVAAARRCLHLATDEVIRDEAENLLACGLHYLGDNHGALESLQTAIEGDYSVALLANIGVVAAHLDAELAAQHLARIVQEAPSVGMRANAAQQALLMWRSDDSKMWQGEDAEHLRLPPVLRQPLRSIVTEQISPDDFRAIASAMALFDAEWLRLPQSLGRSPYRDSLEARYYRARAAEDGFMSVVDVFATVTDWSAAPDWLVAERENLVEQTIDYLFEHIDDPDNTAGVIAQALVRKVRGLRPRERVVLALLAVATLTYHVTEQDGEIADSIVELFRQAEREASTLDGNDGKDGEDGKDREMAAELIELGCRRIACNLHQARMRQLNDLVDGYNAALSVLNRAPSGTSLWFQARHQIAEVVDACRQTRAQLDPWLRRVANADLREALVELMEHSREFEFSPRSALEH